MNHLPNAAINTAKKSTFLYETHMHTCEGSACAGDNGAAMARAHKAAGYTGIIITDHFFNGNTAVPSNLPWETRVELFCKGYENAHEEGKRIGLHVFFGWEYAYKGTEFLTYGLDKDFLLSHPDMLSWSVEEYLTTVRRAGGFVSHAHPFREAPYIRAIRLYPEYVDAVEVINASHSNPEYDRKALSYAKEHNLLMTSGSDSHHADRLSGGGIEFSHELFSSGDFIQALRDKTSYRLLGRDKSALNIYHNIQEF